MSNNIKVMGAPLKFTERVDPNGRVFFNTFLSDTPFLNIIPGRPKFLHDVLKGQNLDSDDAELIRRIVNGRIAEQNRSSIFGWLGDSTKDQTDYRYYSFQEDFSEYLKYLEVMLTSVRVKMGLEGKDTFLRSAYTPKFGQGNMLRYWIDKNVSVSDDYSNDFTSSALDGVAKSVSGITRELRFLLGRNLNTKDLLEGTKGNGSYSTQEIQAKVDDIMKGGFFEKLQGIGGYGKAATIINGSNLLYPQIWSDSTYSKNFSATMRFYSPYGDMSSIYNNVYLPLISLMALTLPRHDALMSYSSPFLIRADIKGYMTIDLGVVASLNVVKGGDENLWTKDGLPNEVVCSISLKDLYPVMMMSKRYDFLVANYGLAGYLDNMAGIAVTDFKADDNLSAWFNHKLNSVRPGQGISKLNIMANKMLQDFKEDVNNGVSFFTKLLK